jgi:hypothetical protein
MQRTWARRLKPAGRPQETDSTKCIRDLICPDIDLASCITHIQGSHIGIKRVTPQIKLNLASAIYDISHPAHILIW